MKQYVTPEMTLTLLMSDDILTYSKMSLGLGDVVDYTQIIEG